MAGYCGKQQDKWKQLILRTQKTSVVSIVLPSLLAVKPQEGPRE